MTWATVQDAIHPEDVLDAVTGPGPDAVLVLTGLDAIGEQAAATTAALLRMRPAGVRLVLEARTAPPWLHTALIGSRRLELGPDDLAFSSLETSSVLRRAGGVDVDADTVAAVQEAAEGWPAVVAMTADGLGRAPHDGVPGSGASVDAAIEEYLVAEVLDAQPPPVRHFLLATAALDELTPDLCRVVLGDDRAPGVLARLTAATGLVVADADADGAPRWRYRRALRAALERHVGRNDPELARVARERAGPWHAQQRRLPLGAGTGQPSASAPPPADTPPAARLTDGELRVLRLLRGSLPATSLARELGITPNTLKTHRRSIYAKLQVSSRGEAVRRAVQLGLLDASCAASASTPFG